jgi:hypothetical protein
MMSRGVFDRSLAGIERAMPMPMPLSKTITHHDSGDAERQSVENNCQRARRQQIENQRQRRAPLALARVILYLYSILIYR